jgi:hypothetical protein
MRTGRRRIATRRLADATSIGCVIARRPASTRHASPIHDLAESTI